MDDIIQRLSVLLADTYALYLKTQNYHWHVTGPQFRTLHQLFEEQYQELAKGADDIAERIRILGHHAPASFKEFEQLKQIKDGNSQNSANQMVIELADDHQLLIADLNKVIKKAQEQHDEGLTTLLSDRIASHQKASWMLNVSKE